MPNMDSSESDGRRCVFSCWFGQDVFACGDGELLTESGGLFGVRYGPEALRRNEGPQSSYGLFEHAALAYNREQLFRSASPAARPETSAAAAGKNDSVKAEFLLRHVSSHQHNPTDCRVAKTKVFQLTFE